MASGGSWSLNNFCPICGRQVEVLNGDFQFSMELHMQSHKSLDAIDKQFKDSQVISRDNQNFLTNYICPQCNENVEIVNNDVTLSLQLHSEKHKFGISVKKSEDRLSNSSGRSKNSEKNNSNMKSKRQPQPVQLSILDSVFINMPPGLQTHQGFVIENDSGKAFCNICKMNIESVISVSDHLKTKLHEDNVIVFLKSKVSVDLHQIMDFVSFYGSNLCCNLCRCKIQLCSTNPYETVVNVMAHNASKSHLKKKKTQGDSSGQNDGARLILNTFSHINSLVNENRDFIDCKMQPQFKCQLCDKNIVYEQNENGLLKNFIHHLSSVGHTRCFKATSVLKSFEVLNLPAKQKYNFTALKGSIYCKVCDSPVEVNIEELILHAKGKNCKPKNASEELSPSLNKMSLNSSSDTFINAPPPPVTSCEETGSQKTLNLKDLLNSLPVQFRNVNYIIKNDQGGVTCLVCDRIIPATTYNLQTHLEGKSHKKTEEAANLNSGNPNQNNTQPQNNFVEPQEDQAVPSLDQVYNLLLKTDPVIACNNKLFVKCVGGILCRLCSAVIPGSLNIITFRQNIRSHIESCKGKQITNSQNEVPKALSNDKKVATVKELFELLPKPLQNDKTFIKNLSNGINQVICWLCKVKISAHHKCLQEHLEGTQHLTSVKNHNLKRQENKAVVNNDVNNDEDVLLVKIMNSDKIIQSLAKYLIKRDQHYFCDLCKATIIRSYDEQQFKGNLLSHASGQKHKMNIGKVLDGILDRLCLSDPVIKTNRSFLERKNDQLYCSLCACFISVSTEVKSLLKNLVTHLAGNAHANKKLGNLHAQKNIQKVEEIPTPKVSPMNKQMQKVEEISTPNLEASANFTSVDPIKVLFRTLPLNFQNEIVNIRVSAIEGYVFCTLCNFIINPHYLTDHLEENTHIRKKLDQTNSTNVTERQNVKSNMGSLSSLLGNIDKKMSWPLKQ